ncbi:hypothetical protein A2U01_0061441, partial [Trifolium medium]|nr:hypothetical protein [Trifolium medium]
MATTSVEWWRFCFGSLSQLCVLGLLHRVEGLVLGGWFCWMSFFGPDLADHGFL